MFSVEFFYTILTKNLIVPIKSHFFYFSKFGSVDPVYLTELKNKDLTTHPGNLMLCYDQEPLYYNYFEAIHTFSLEKTSLEWLRYLKSRDLPLVNNHFNVLINSEHSLEKDKILSTWDYYDWYYFYHGFAALDWYRDFQYVNPGSFNRFTKVFICLNHLVQI